MINDVVDILVAASPVMAGGIAVMLVRRDEKKWAKSTGPLLIDGRTQREWYELIKGMGRESYEELSVAPIDVAQDDQGNYTMDRNPKYGWNVERLVGQNNYRKLMLDWYPERFCKHCRSEGCKETCRPALQSIADASLAKHNNKLPDEFTTRYRFVYVSEDKYRVHCGGRVENISTKDIYSFQSRMKLRLTGQLDAETKKTMVRMMENGIPLKEEKSNGITWSVVQGNRPGVVNVVASNGTEYVSEAVLEECVSDLAPIIGKDLRARLAKKEVGTTDVADKRLDKAVKELERHMRIIDDLDKAWNGKGFKR